MSQLPKAQIDQLQAFVTLLKARPAMLHDPGLQFFRDYLISLGATLPSPPPQEEKKPEKSPEPEPVPPKETEKMEEEEVVESDPESEVDLDMTGVIGKLYVNLLFCISWLRCIIRQKFSLDKYIFIIL